MKALRFLRPYELKVMDVPDPVMKDDECLLRIRACGICGSDPAGYTGKSGRRIPPMTMGHEFSAEVAATGKEVKNFRKGDRVVVQPINFCGHCDNCKNGLTMLCENKKFFGVLTTDGAMAEYVSVPEKLLYRLPENTTFYEGALTEPYAVAYGGWKKAEDLRDKIVLIIGAGMIGDCVLQMVEMSHPAMIIMADLSDNRLAVSKELGADYVINTGKVDAIEEIRRITDGHMIDYSFEAVGVQATANLSVKALRIAGTAIWIGMNQKEMTLNMQDVVCSARRVIGSFNYTHKEFGEVVQLIGSGKLQTDRMISKVVPLEEAPAMFDNLLSSPEDYLKVIIDPTIGHDMK